MTLKPVLKCFRVMLYATRSHTNLPKRTKIKSMSL